MANFGFVINNRTCIGCHACSTACKSENEVPLGVYRTWVKYTEVGTYPDVRRNFQVTRCNHCANPPCVRICPVTAMYQRDDGIVEFDQDVCIGCKACLQACPYDAIHVDPDSGTAAKCHYCSHRTDLGLEPACVVVCPEHAIIAGDLDDPTSEISRVLTKEQVSVRKPEQGTAPKLFYIDGNDFALTPTAGERTPESFLWADVLPLHGGEDHAKARTVEASGRNADSGVALRSGQPQGDPVAGPIQFAPGRSAEHMVQTSYNAQHEIPWHWPVPAYLVTKGIGGGLYSLLSIGILTGLFSADGPLLAVGSLVALVFIGLTTVFLIYDLERPERFLTIVTRPQWRSWLTRGAFVLIAFSALLTLHFAIEAGGVMGLVSAELVESVRGPALVVGLPLAAGTLVYTAFLFGQAEGRDLWQSTLLPAHLLIQGLMVGSGALIVIGAFLPLSAAASSTAAAFFATALIVDLIVTLFGEMGMPHGSDVAARAAHEIRSGRYQTHFWLGSIVIGHVLPLIVFFVSPVLLPWAVIAVVIGLYAFEYAFVMAPQEVPNS